VTIGIEGLGLIGLEKAMDALLCKWVIKALKPSNFLFVVDHCTFFLFFLVLGHFSLGPDLPPCSLSYPPKYCTNLGTLFIIPY